MGIELNNSKRELPASATRHLGFLIDLKRKAIMITQKNRRKITTYFDNFLVAARKKERLSVRGIQRMLGLQRWITIVFFRTQRTFSIGAMDTLMRTIGLRFNTKYEDKIEVS